MFDITCSIMRLLYLIVTYFLNECPFCDKTNLIQLMQQLYDYSLWHSQYVQFVVQRCWLKAMIIFKAIHYDGVGLNSIIMRGFTKLKLKYLSIITKFTLSMKSAHSVKKRPCQCLWCFGINITCTIMCMLQFTAVS